MLEFSYFVKFYTLIQKLHLQPEAPAEFFQRGGGQATYPFSTESNKTLQLQLGFWSGAWNQKLI